MSGQEKLDREIDRLMTMSAEAVREKRTHIVCKAVPMLAILALAKLALNIGLSSRAEAMIAEAAVTEVQTWEMMHDKATPDHLGLIPSFLDASSDKSLADQLNDGYQHGGGYPNRGWSSSPGRPGPWRYDAEKHTLNYPGDPPFTALWRMSKGDEELIVFGSAIVMVRDRKTGSFVVGRMD